MEMMYFLARDTVSQKFDKDDKLFAFYVVGLYCLLCTYHDYTDTVINSFLNTEIYFENGSVYDILLRHEKSPENLEDIKKEQEEFLTYAVSCLGHEFSYDENEHDIIHIFHNPYIVASIDNDSYEKLLNSFCHEMGHIIKGKINSFEILSSQKNDYEFYSRTGFSYDYYFTENNELYHYNQGGILDEAINVLQTTDALCEVKALKDFVEDDDVLDFISKLDFSILEKDCGYDEVVSEIRDLWNNERFRELCLFDSISGEVNLVIDFGFMGDNTFETFENLLEELFELVLDDEKKEKLNAVKCDISRLIKGYNEKYKEYVKKK